MPSTYTTNLGIELPADGELDGVWGDVVNENMDILDRAINGSIALSLSGTSSTLTTSDGTLSDGQYKLLVLGGTPSGTHTITIAPNDAQKIYFVRNTTAQSVVFTQGSGGNVTIATGDSAIIYSDGAGAGAAVVNITNDFAMSSVKITGGTIDGTVIGGTSAAAGTFTTANATTVDTTNIEVTTIKAKDGTSAGSIADSTGVVTLASSVLTTTDINGGTIDGAVIGGSSAAAGTFTTVTSGLGAVGTPSITFTGDTNTGMWSPAADTIAFSEGGVEAMRITSAGNVGIGTTTPGADLHVNNAAASQGRRGVRISASGWTGVYGELVLDTSAIKMDLNSSNGTYPLSFSIAGTERMRIDASGNVGIGTSSPATTLDVNGDVTITDKIIHSGDTNTAIRFPAADTVTVETSGTERMRIDSTGAVGIATTTPAGLLEVFDVLTVPARNTTTIASKRGLSIYNNQSAGQVDTTLVYGNTANSYLAIGNHNGTSYAERMRIDSSGNVGIGTTTPASKLNVVGDQIVISGSSGTGGLGLQIKGTVLEAIPAAQVQGYIATGNSSIGVAGDLLIAPRTSAAANIRFITGTTPAEVVRISSTGRIGIGNSNPAVPLDIGGQADLSVRLLTTTNSVDFRLQALGTVPSTLLNTVSNHPLAFATNNTERMRIDSTGNVGIGTTAPDALLSVNGVASFGDGSAAAPSITNLGDLNTGMFFPAADTIAFAEGGTEAMRITSDGRVGIGTTAPATPLDVTGNIRTSLGSGGTITAFETDATRGNRIVLGADASGAYINSTFTLAGSSVLRFEGAGTERMRIDASGNVGIGSASPIEKLDVRGGVFIGNVASGINYDGMILDYNTSTREARLAVGATSGGSSFFTFTTSNGGTEGERMRITSAGNVGIGTASPASIVGGTDTSPVLSIGGTDSALVTGDKSGSLSFITNDTSYTATYADGVTSEIASISESSTGAAYGLAVYTGTTGGRAERVRITSVGNVGIGVTIPAARLDVTGLENTLQARFGGVASRGFEISTAASAGGRNDSTSILNAKSDATVATMVFQTDSTERMRIDSAGNVGIGTNSPASLLNLQAATPTLTSVSTTTTGTTLGNKGNRVLLRANSSTVGNGGEIVWAAADTDTGRWAAISGHIVGNASGSAFGDVVFATKTAGADTALSERLRLTAAGALVIGNGDTAASPAAGFLRATGGSGTDITGATLNIQGGRGTGSGAGGPITFSTSAAGTTGTTLNAATERMRIDSNGRVGIGTTSMSFSLDVRDATGGTISVITASGNAALRAASTASGTAQLQLVNSAGTQTIAGGVGSVNNMVFSVNSTEAMRIDASGRLLIGTTTATTVSGNQPHLQVRGSSSNTSSAALTRTSADTNGPLILLGKERSGAIVNSGDTLGIYGFSGYDGAAYQSAAWIAAFVDGTPGLNDMPGRLVFSTTTDGAVSPTERMRIDSAGNVGIGTTAPNAASIIDAQSTTKGVRFPNMTTTQKNAMANVAGNVIFDTTLGKLCVNTGAGWQTITSV